MTNKVEDHYRGSGALAKAISDALLKAGKNLSQLTTTDLAAVDEFHIRGRKATLELGEQMKLSRDSRALDIGSGLGGPARTLAEIYGCHVTGVDLTQEFCDAAVAMSDWVNLGDRVAFRQGDATSLPFEDGAFDAAMTIHVAMNIPAKDKVYEEARRVIKPGGVFAVYDILQGECGEVLFPVPWAREPSISHLATIDEMQSLVSNAGFKILDIQDSSAESESWFEAMKARMAETGPPPINFQVFLGSDFPAMVQNQVRNLTERRIRTVSFICEA